MPEKRCPLCEFIIAERGSTYTQLHAHIVSAHGAAGIRALTVDRPLVENDNDGGFKFVTCEVCDALDVQNIFVNRMSLGQHRRQQHPGASKSASAAIAAATPSSTAPSVAPSSASTSTRTLRSTSRPKAAAPPLVAPPPPLPASPPAPSPLPLDALPITTAASPPHPAPPPPPPLSHPHPNLFAALSELQPHAITPLLSFARNSLLSPDGVAFFDSIRHPTIRTHAHNPFSHAIGPLTNLLALCLQSFVDSPDDASAIILFDALPALLLNEQKPPPCSLDITAQRSHDCLVRERISQLLVDPSYIHTLAARLTTAHSSPHGDSSLPSAPPSAPHIDRTFDKIAARMQDGGSHANASALKSLDSLVSTTPIYVGPDAGDQLSRLQVPVSSPLDPPALYSSLSSVPCTSVALTTIATAARNAVQKLKAHGESGPSDSLVLSMLNLPDDHPGRTALLTALQGFAAIATSSDLDALSPLSRDIVYDGRAILLTKAPGKYRPLVISTFLDKFLAKLAMLDTASLESVVRFCAPYQHAIGTPDGTNQLVHALNSALADYDPDDTSSPPPVLLQLDFANAFNSVKLSAFFPILERILPPTSLLRRIVTRKYSQQACLYIRHDAGISTVLSMEGARQGCSFGSLIFCIPMAELMRKILSTPSLNHLSPALYADDTNLIASAHDALTFASAVATSGPEYGLVTVPHKSIAYVHDSVPDSDISSLQAAGFQIKRDGTIVCGAPIGSDAYVASFLSNHAASLAPMHDLLIRFADRHPRQALVLRNSWLSASSNHLYRSVRPALTTAHLVPVISVLNRSFLASISIGHDNLELIGKDSMTIAQLPSSMGNIGLGCPLVSAFAGFSASGLSFLSRTARHHSDLPGLTDAVHGAFALGSSFKAYVNAGTAHLPDRLPSDTKRAKTSKPAAPPPPDTAPNPRPRKAVPTHDLSAAEILLNPSVVVLLADGKPRSGVQRAFTRGMFSKQRDSLALYGGNARTIATWSSSPGSGAFSSAPFTHHDLRMDALAVRSHVTMLIGMKPMALHSVPDETHCSLCANKRPLGSGAQHLDACPHSPGYFPAHNAVAHAIVRICVEAGVDAKHESKSKLDVSTNPAAILTPDITLNTSAGPLALDVVVRRPEQSTLNLRTPQTTLSSEYRHKLVHYYGAVGGDILFKASSNYRSSYFLNQHDSDYSLIAAQSVAPSPAVVSPPNPEMPPSPPPPATSSMPSRPTRPMVINGITGALEARAPIEAHPAPDSLRKLRKLSARDQQRDDPRLSPDRSVLHPRSSPHAHVDDRPIFAHQLPLQQPAQDASRSRRAGALIICVCLKSKEL